ncbi:MAG: histidine ammonia-lyase [Saprospiraceae bacterium]
MKEVHILDFSEWTLRDIISIWKSDLPIGLSEQTWKTVADYRNSLEEKIATSSTPVYGINTGFGALCNQVIASEELSQLQINLVRSHACGTGPYIDVETCKLMLLLKIISLSKGNSCIRPELLQFLIQIYNEKIFPEIPERGSLGASGDLAPLAHMSLLCIGEGKIISTEGNVADLLKSRGIHPPMLRMKEGLALLNGTQYTLATLLNALYKSNSLFKIANITSALSIDAFNCTIDFLNEEIHLLRKQKGQIEVSATLRQLLSGSNIQFRSKISVQDPYSFRCIPQVHGATLDCLHYVEDIVTREINAVTDNPLMLSQQQVLSGGNFHAQPLALAADFLCIAVAELASISERRIYQLINGARGLPDFLTTDPGLNSGYMIVQYSAASLVSQNKQLCTPASVDSIVTSKGQEDHVSMGANAALKARAVTERTGLVLAMEWMTACRAWQLRGVEWKTGDKLQFMFQQYRELIPYREKDHIPSEEFEKTLEFLMHVNSASD